MGMPNLDIRIETEADVTVVRLRGELDVATIPDLREGMVELRSMSPASVVIDAGDLVSVGVRGVRALTAEVQALRQGRRSVTTVNLRPAVRRVARLLFAEAQLGATCSRR